MNKKIKSDPKVKRSTKIAMALDTLRNDGYPIAKLSENGERATFVKR